jgi:hypothetical protein
MNEWELVDKISELLNRILPETIIERVEDLLKAEKKLDALESLGVDNWAGYDDAMDLLDEETI